MHDSGVQDEDVTDVVETSEGFWSIVFAESAAVFPFAGSGAAVGAPVDTDFD